MKGILDLVSNYLSITGHGNDDSIIFGIIIFIGVIIAYKAVGLVFDGIGFYDSDLMSGTNYIIQFIFFLITYSIIKVIYSIVSWLFSFELWVYVLFAIFVLLFLLTVHYFSHKYNKNKYSTIKVEIENQNPIIHSNIVDSNKRAEPVSNTKCPRCGGVLIYRFGPYGTFWGCNNYKGNSFGTCKYTRKRQ